MVAMMQSIVLLLVGFVLLIKGADFFVEGSSSVARALRIPSMIVGLTIVAMGTSLPELAVSVTASVAGNNALAVSNVIGSNLFNLMFVCGACALFAPLIVQKDTLKKEIPVSVLCAVLLFVLGISGRIGGDEFAFCYAGELEPERIRHNADKILEILRTQHVNEQTGEVLPVPCSIGIVMSQGDTLDYTQLIRKADLAMYQAKENGKNTFVLNVD